MLLTGRGAARMLAVAFINFAATAVSGQDYPSKPIRIYTTAAGGGSDFTARLVAQGMSGMGQPVIVENRPSGIIAAEIVAKSPPDGYSLTVNGGGFIIATFQQKMSYDVLRDFVPITLIERQVSIVMVHPSLPVKSAGDLIKLAKGRPGELNYSSGGVGTAPQLAAELFKTMAGVDMVHVAYKGGGNAMTALLSGEVQVSFVNGISSVAQHVKSGKLKALAVTSLEPSALAPGLPTVAASGLPGYEFTGSTSIFAPARTPAPIITKVNQEIVRFLRTADAKEKFLSAGIEVVGSTPEESLTASSAEVNRLGKILKGIGVRVN
jgi:tripartite-type tricarboxylate transporter receptor subunit TctC